MKKKKTAVAIKYNDDYKTPKVTAMGFGQIAENILTVAENSSIPIIENEELANDLSRVDINTEIPPELYEAVAEIIAFIYYMDSKTKK